MARKKTDDRGYWVVVCSDTGEFHPTTHGFPGGPPCTGDTALGAVIERMEARGFLEGVLADDLENLKEAIATAIAATKGAIAFVDNLGNTMVSVVPAGEVRRFTLTKTVRVSVDAIDPSTLPG